MGLSAFNAMRARQLKEKQEAEKAKIEPKKHTVKTEKATKKD